MLSNVYIGAAILGGVALLFQFALMLFGIGDDDLGGDAAGADASGGADAGGAGAGAAGPTGADAHGFWFFEMLSIRTVTAAVAFFGLTGQAFHASGVHPAVSITAALAAGYAAMYCVYWVFRQLFRLETSGNEDIRNAIGRVGQVYVPVPGAAAGAGKVTLKLQNRTVEYQAVTDDPERLKTGEPVVVVDLISGDTVKVARTREPVDA